MLFLCTPYVLGVSWSTPLCFAFPLDPVGACWIREICQICQVAHSDEIVENKSLEEVANIDSLPVNRQGLRDSGTQGLGTGDLPMRRVDRVTTCDNM